MTAPIASGWSGCRVGLAPTGKRRLVTAHTQNGHSVLKAQINKTDRNNARGIAQMRRASQRGPARFPSQTRI
jgi:hypothetical protein